MEKEKKIKLRAKYEARAVLRKRARDVGVEIGKYKTGKLNAITDVKGVRVGHSTIIEGTGKRKTGHGPVRTGVTAIIPNDNIFENKLVAGGFILNGAGEVAGFTQMQEWGLLETPILLTNTMSVGRVGNTVNAWMAQQHHMIGNEQTVIIPVVGECDDSFLNDAVGLHVRGQHVLAALESAQGGVVEEGCVGAGTGMICCDLKAGIGTASRVFEIDKKKFTIGILVLSNFGYLHDLRVDGFPVGKTLEDHYKNYKKRKNNYGSIITVLATDLPVTPIQITRLCKRAALGIGRVGSFAAHGSGEIVVGFSTANKIREESKEPFFQLKMVADTFLNPVYDAVVECTEEAIINSITKAYEMDGVEGNYVPAIDLELLEGIMKDYRQVGLKNRPETKGSPAT